MCNKCNSILDMRRNHLQKIDELEFTREELEKHKEALICRIIDKAFNSVERNGCSNSIVATIDKEKTNSEKVVILLCDTGIKKISNKEMDEYIDKLKEKGL